MGSILPFVRALAPCLLFIGLQGCGGGGDDSPASGTNPPGPVNRAPAAAAGPDLTSFKGAAVSLDGTGSTDADGNALSYRWTQTAGKPVTLSSTTSSHPAFTAPAHSGRLTFQLIVNDGQTDSVADTVNIDVANRAPIASIAAVDPLAPQTAALLDASASSDPDGDSLTYSWTQSAGPTVTATTLPGGQLTFTVPDGATTMTFVLSVSDGEMTSLNVTININIVVSPPAPTPTPTAPAVASTQITTGKRQSVSLAILPLAHRYEWRQTAGTPVAFDDDSAQQTSFQSPATTGELRFEARTGNADGTLWSPPREVVVTVRNYAPQFGAATLTPSAPRTADTLTFTAPTSDPDDDPLTVSYAWRRNGVVVSSQTGPTFPPALTTKGDVILGKAIVTDGAESASVEVSTTIVDTPAIIVGTLPTSLAFGSSINVQLATFDDDGDAAPPFALSHGPAGFAVSSNGHVTWTPHGPLFDRDTNFKWGIELQGVTDSRKTGIVRVNDPARTYALRRTSMPAPRSQHGVRIGDFDGDGQPEMLVLGSYALAEVRKSGSSYVERWVYPYNTGAEVSGNATSVAAGDIDGDNKAEIFFSIGRTLVRLDGATRHETKRVHTGDQATGLRCLELELADLDRDGTLELGCLSGTAWEASVQLAVLDPVTLGVEWAAPLNGSFFGSDGLDSLAIGNVDADAALELVIGDGRVYDGATHQMQWNYGAAFGRQVMVGDVDGNGVDEILAFVGYCCNALIRGYDAVARSPLWEITNANTPALGFSGIETAIVADTDGDHVAEVIIANGNFFNGWLTALRYSAGSFQTAFQIPYLQSGTSGLAIGNTDGDAHLELVLGYDIASSAPDVLAVADIGAGAFEWASASEPLVPDLGFVGGALARLSNGQSRLMFVTPKSVMPGSDGVRITALDPATGTWTFSSKLGDNYNLAAAMFVSDFDADSSDEIVLCTDTSYDGSFVAHDFANDLTEWSTPASSFEYCKAIAHADMNGDGSDDLIAASSLGYVYVYDMLHSALLWKSTAMYPLVDVDTIDIEGDGDLEIVVLQGFIPGTSATLSIYKKSAGPVAYLLSDQAQISTQGYPWALRDLLIADVTGAGSEIFVLATNEVLVYDTQLTLKRTVPVAADQRAQSLYVEQSASPRKNLLVALNDGTGNVYWSTQLWAVDSFSGAEVWRSPALYGDIPINGLYYVDTDSDGELELSFGTRTSMYLVR